MSKSILAIDDEPAILIILQEILAPTGREFHSAMNGKDGLKKARELKPELIILDVQLPDMLGFDVCEAIRADALIAATPILMLSAQRTSSLEKTKGLNTGADDYVTKPFQNDLLLARVKALLRRGARP